MTLGFDLTQDGWLQGIPKSQALTIEAFLSAGNSEEQVAELWLSKIGSPTTVGFGGAGPLGSFYLNVKAEFVAFVCGDAKYDDERRQASEIWNRHGKVGLVSMVAALIASTVGLAAAAIVPVIALLFSLVAKIGVNAFCTSCQVEIE